MRKFYPGQRQWFRILLVIALVVAQVHGLSVSAVGAQPARYVTDPVASVTSGSGEVVLHKELSGYPRYGTADSAADILYPDQTATWTFALPPGVYAGMIRRAFFRVAIVADDHDGVAAANYSYTVAANGAQVFAGPANLPHGSPFASVFTNWQQRDYVSTIWPAMSTITITNTSSTGADDWLAVDWVELHLLVSAGTPIVFVPGIMGSTMVDGTGHGVWPSVLSSTQDRLMMQDDGTTPLNPDITAQDVMWTFYGPSIYDDLRQHLRDKGYKVFGFPYDWRNAAFPSHMADTTASLDRLVDSARQQTGSSQVILMGHSTGGLLARSYVQEHPDKVNTVVYMGVPFMGAADAVYGVLEGECAPYCVVTAREAKKLSRNFQTVYQLMPARESWDYQQTDWCLNLASCPATPFTDVTGDTADDYSLDRFADYLDGTERGSAQSRGHGAWLKQAAYGHAARFDGNNHKVPQYLIAGSGLPSVVQVARGTIYDLERAAWTQTYVPWHADGDGTVPLLSSTLLGHADLYLGEIQGTWYLKASHGKIPDVAATSGLLDAILTGHVQPDQKLISDKPFGVTGTTVIMHSPASIRLVDDQGRLTPDPAAGFTAQIPGSNYQEYGDLKVLFAPDGNYRLELQGTGTGRFTMEIRHTTADRLDETAVFKDIPVTPATQGHVQINTGNRNYQLQIQDGSSAAQTLSPSYILPDNTALDNLPPRTSIDLHGTQGAVGWFTSDVDVSLAAADNLSGVLTTYSRLDGGAVQAGSHLTLTAEGAHTLEFWSVDRAGNAERSKTARIQIDKSPPVTVATETPAPNANGWHRSDVSVTLAATDNLSGVAGTEYNLDGAGWAAYSSSIPVTTEGVHTLLYRSTDVAGNVEAAQSLTVRIAKTPPEAYLQFDPAGKDLQLFGRVTVAGLVNAGPIAPTSVSPAKSDNGDREGDEKGKDQGDGELRTYQVSDLAGNTLTVVVKVKKEGHQIQARIVSLQYNVPAAQYNGGAVITPAPGTMAVQWEADKQGKLKELEQNVVVGAREHRRQVEAQFVAGKNATIITVSGPTSESKVKQPGLTLLRLETTKGEPMIQY